jgi:NAD(P)H dehydrogenase (quinone)
MGKILVTGASGNIGRLTLKSLLKRKPSSQLVGLVRDPSKAEDLKELGIELRVGDYMDTAALLRAFKGIEKVQLTSTHAFTDRKTAHGNVVDAAAKSGVEHITYMPIIRKENSDFVLQQVTEEDLFTEQKIFDSGMTYTFLQHPPFADTLPFYMGANAPQIGVRVTSGNGKTAAATREDLADAHAVVLIDRGHENKSYPMTSQPALSFADMTELLSGMLGKEVPYITVSDEEYSKILSETGIPRNRADFVRDWVVGINRGEWAHTTKDLEKLIGRKPTTIEEVIRRVYLKGASR